MVKLNKDACYDWLRTHDLGENEIVSADAEGNLSAIRVTHATNLTEQEQVIASIGPSISRHKAEWADDPQLVDQIAHNLETLKASIARIDNKSPLLETIEAAFNTVLGKEPESTEAEQFFAREKEVQDVTDPLGELQAALSKMESIEDLKDYSLIGKKGMEASESWVKVISENNHLFAGIHGAGLLKGTDIEGGQRSWGMKFVSKLFGALGRSEALSSLDPSVIEGLQWLTKLGLDGCIKWDERINEAALRGKGDKGPNILDKVTREAVQQIKKLVPGQRLLIPGGFKGNPGHAMLYMIERGQEGKPNRFVIFNTGAGIEYHSRSGDDLFQLFHSFEGASLEEMATPSMWRVLMECHLVPHWNSKTERSSLNIYRAIQGTLCQNPNVKQGLWADRDATPMAGQISGNCFWQVMHPLFCHELGFAAHKRVKFEIKLLSLVGYFVANKDTFANSEIKRRLLRQAVRGTAISLMKRWDPDNPETAQLPINRVVQATATLREITEHLDSLEQATETTPPSLTGLADGVSDRTPDAFGYLTLLHAQNVGEDSIHYSGFKVEKTLDDSSWPLINQKISSPEALLAFLESTDKGLKILVQARDHGRSANREQLTHLERLIECLPIPASPRSDDLWNQIPEDQMERAQEILQKLQEAYHDTLCWHTPSEKAMAPERVIASYRLLVAIDKLGRRICQKKGMDVISKFGIPSQHLDKLIQGRETLYSRTPEFQANLIALRHYTRMTAGFPITTILNHLGEPYKGPPELEKLMTPEGRKKYEKEMETYKKSEMAYKKDMRISLEQYAKYLKGTDFGSRGYFPQEVTRMRRAVILACGAIYREPEFSVRRSFKEEFFENWGYKGERVLTLNKGRYDTSPYRTMLGVSEGLRNERRIDYEKTPSTKEAVDWLQNILRGNLTVEESVMLGQEVNDDFPEIQNPQQLALLGTSQREPTKIADTLLFFRENLELLNQPRWRGAFDSLIFHGETLLKQAREEPQLLLNIQEFLNDALTLHMDLGHTIHLDAALYLLRTSMYIERFMHDLHVKMPTEAVNYMKRLDLLTCFAGKEDHGLRKGQRNVIARTRLLCRLNQEAITREQWYDIAMDRVTSKLGEFKGKSRDFQIDQEIEQHLIERRNEYLQALSGPGFENLFDRLLERISPELATRLGGLEWHQAFPQLLKGDRFELNLMTGNWDSLEGSLKWTPEEWKHGWRNYQKFLEEPPPSIYGKRERREEWETKKRKYEEQGCFYRLLAGKQYQGLYEEGCYSVTDQECGELRVHAGHGDIKKIEKKMPNGKWYTYVPLRDGKLGEIKGLQTNEQQGVLRELLKEDKLGLWICTDRSVGPCVTGSWRPKKVVNVLENPQELDVMIYDWDEQRPVIMITPGEDVKDKASVDKLPGEIKKFSSTRASYGFDRQLMIRQGGDIHIQRVQANGEPGEILGSHDPKRELGSWYQTLGAFGTSRIQVCLDPESKALAGVELKGLTHGEPAAPIRFHLDASGKQLVFAGDPRFHLVAVSGKPPIQSHRDSSSEAVSTFRVHCLASLS